MDGRGKRSGAGASAAALPFAWAGARHPSGDWRRWLAGCLQEEIEQRRLFPWIAVAFGAGIVLFFSAEGRPALWAPLAGVVVAGAAAVALRHRLWSFAAAVAATAVFAGFAAP